ncbi:MAG TPA: hypothetical protein VFO77_09765 [Actinoplanes sp.]|nr:hypothetical protein [Actinoplanes sp.]
MQSTATGVQATERVEDLLQEAYRQLPPGATLKPRGGVAELPCDDPTDNGPAGRVFIEKVYQVAFPAGWPADRALPALVQYWQPPQYRVHNDRRDAPDPRFAVETTDGYRVSIEVFVRPAGNLDVYLGGSSPCVWEHGTPDPQ